ncbi:MAG: permease [Bacteroidaceae bacterium]|nr:permease [Bacteroidaceae bacterium]
MDFLLPFIELLNEMSPYLLLGFFIAGLLHAFVPNDLYRRLLSAGNFRSVFYATLFGVPLPLCSCGVIPTAMSLRRNGASKGSTVAFLIATPQTGVDSILATWALMGAPFAILRPVTAFITALAGGTLTNLLEKKEGDTEQDEETRNEEELVGKGFIARMKTALRYGFVEMIQDIGKWLIIGLAIAGLITLFLPDNFFALYADYPILNMLLVLAIGIPMYLCATGSIPIAAALMLKGLSPGAALVFLMAGPATNMAAILVINKVMKSKALCIYLFSIIAGAIAFGLFTDYVLPAEWFTPLQQTGCAGNCHEETQTAWWKIVSSVIFIILLVNAYLKKGHCHEADCQCHQHTSSVETTKAERRTFTIKGMNCNHCRTSIEKALKEMEGITWVEVSLDAEEARVAGDATDQAIIETIESLGFQVER